MISTTTKEALRKAAYRARLKAEGRYVRPKDKPGRVRIRVRNRQHAIAPFVGVDGEGAGHNRFGQQHYLLLRIGERELFTGRPLTTQQCLEFILDEPPGSLLVGYGFGYDSTQILRSISDDANGERAENRIKHLFAPKPSGRGGAHYTRWNQWGIEYLPRQYLRVSRQERYVIFDELTGLPREAWRTVKGSARTIYETLGFFQSTFLSALRAWEVGAEYWELIERNKARRSDFRRMTKEVREYNRLECQLLAELMERFRAVCGQVDLHPATWNGPGKIAAYLHQRHRSIERVKLEAATPAPMLQMANDAYFGGRFEVTQVGAISGPVYEYDLNSAYPQAMRSLPCLHHGGWKKSRPALLANSRALFVAAIRFSHPQGIEVCGFPVRQKTGKLFWPRMGGGVYWSPEIRAAERLGAKVEYLEGWHLKPACTCTPYDWIEPLYEARRALGKDLRGQPLKLGLNSLYGKLAQRVGSPRFGNLIHAGLITAFTRAALVDAIVTEPDAVLMFATDAVFTTRPLKLDCGERLGQWTSAEHEKLFIVQPGLYWGAKRPKTRGIPSESLFTEHVPKFEKAWAAWIDLYEMLGTWPGIPPVVGVPMKMFVGLRQALHRGDLRLAGQWTQIGKRGPVTDGSRTGKRFSFVWKGKRSTADFGVVGSAVITQVCEGAADLVSLPHRGLDAERLEALDENKWIFDDQPDHVDLSPPY